jgi:hypothetical protein
MVLTRRFALIGPKKYCKKGKVKPYGEYSPPAEANFYHLRLFQTSGAFYSIPLNRRLTNSKLVHLGDCPLFNL